MLGAVIAPTDALAATSIAKRIGLRKQIVDILEGERLVNDASGLLALEFGIAMVVYNRVPSISGGLLRLAYLSVAGIAVGLISGWVVDRVERQIEHAPIENSHQCFRAMRDLPDGGFHSHFRCIGCSGVRTLPQPQKL